MSSPLVNSPSGRVRSHVDADAVPVHVAVYTHSVHDPSSCRQGLEKWI